MFTKSIDNKSLYTDQNGIEVLDIGESFINPEGQNIGLYGIYKVPKNMEMRPDKIAISAYGSDDYTEMVCVYNDIRNPFTIEENDIVYMISLNNIYDNTYEPVSEVVNNSSNNGYDVFRKFLDKSRLPNTVGSEKNTTSVSKSTNYTTTSTKRNLFSTGVNSLIPNVASSGASAIEIKDGKIIYGANNDNYNVTNSAATTSTVGSNNTNNSLSAGSNSLNNALSSSFSVNAVSSNGSITDYNIFDVLANALIKYLQNLGLSTDIINDIISNLNNDFSNLYSLLKNAGLTDEQIDGVYDNLKNTLNNILNNESLASLIANNKLNQEQINDILNSLNNKSTSTTKTSTTSNDNEYTINDNINVADDSQNYGTDVYSNNGNIVFGGSSNVACATDGISMGDYMVKRIKNEIK